MSGRVLITGATGCVGRATMAAALRRGYQVRGLARTLPGPWWPATAEFVAGAVEDKDLLMASAAECDAIVHLASYVHRVPRTSDEVEILRRSIVGGTENTARAAATAGARLILASTVAVYGSRPPVPCDETSAVSPESPYARAKLECEEIARSVCPGSLILRLAVVFGPHDRGNVQALIQAVDRCWALTVGRGDNQKSLVFVDNVAERIMETLEQHSISGTYILADTPAPTQHDLLAEIAAALGKSKPLRLPLRLLLAGAALVDGLGGRGREGTSFRDRVTKLATPTVFDGRKLDEKLGYQSAISWQDGIRRAVGAYRERINA